MVIFRSYDVFYTITNKTCLYLYPKILPVLLFMYMHMPEQLVQISNVYEINVWYVSWTVVEVC